MAERFQLLGVLGRGGTATVHLAQDTLRGERVALKVVHPHLADDPSVARRLRREVEAASLVQHRAALVPYDLHERQGQLALSMPLHQGETLSEWVAARGALPPEKARALGLRLAGALAAAHSAGVLHRDVTAHNVMLSTSGKRAVLTDFGLAQVSQSQTTRSTGLLGTAGYAAPEVYEGRRGDPRSDLYGLGAVLYLAATGKPAFDTSHPTLALKQQLEGSFPKVRAVNPEVPEDLALIIEGLLRPDPNDRPHGARDVVEQLEGTLSPVLDEGTSGAERLALSLPEGDWTVEVHEREEDRLRRDTLRAQRRAGPLAPKHELFRWGQHLWKGLRQAIGLPENQRVSPEDLLVAAVAEAGQLQADQLSPSPALLDRRFRLVDHTHKETALELARQARAAGFHAKSYPLRSPGPLDPLMRHYWFLYALYVIAFPVTLAPMGFESLSPLWLFGVVALAILGGATGGSRRQRRAHDLSVAFEATSAPVTRAPTPTTRGERLRDRATHALEALEAALPEADLPPVAVEDLRRTVATLRSSAQSLGAEVDRAESALGTHGAGAQDVEAMRTRHARLKTLSRAGQYVDPDELQQLQTTLDSHEADQAAAGQLEARLATCTARLLEIASTASRTRRQLVHPQGDSADELVARLQREAKAAAAARQETSRRARSMES